MRAVPVTDRDEPRFAQASRQMAESDRLADWVVPRVGDELRLKKPPLIYWVQAPTVLVATGGDPSQDAIWMYRRSSRHSRRCGSGARCSAETRDCSRRACSSYRP
jgi:hypothetical protein